MLFWFIINVPASQPNPQIKVSHRKYKHFLTAKQGFHYQCKINREK